MSAADVGLLLGLEGLELRVLADGRQGGEVLEVELDRDVVVVDDPAAVALRVHGFEHFARRAGGVVLHPAVTKISSIRFVRW